MEKISMPMSSRSRIIIPSNSAGNRFLKNCYIREYLEDFISERDFNDVVETMSKMTAINFN
jgi:hypothetical protein